MKLNHNNYMGAWNVDPQSVQDGKVCCGRFGRNTHHVISSHNQQLQLATFMFVRKHDCPMVYLQSPLIQRTNPTNRHKTNSRKMLLCIYYTYI